LAIVQLRQVLGSDEQTRADRFHFEKDRRYFIAARAGLRKLLGNYLKVDAAEIQLTYNEYGKPSLAESMNNSAINFNLAHSGGLGLYGFSLGGRIGVDLEYVRAQFTGHEIAEQYFSQSEVAELERVPIALRNQAFFNCWTRKEAFIKALGLGLSLPLKEFDVSLAPTAPAALLQTPWSPQEASRWSLTALDVASGYVAVVAVEGHGWEVHLEHLDESKLLRL
jgi:4'-phosphopantetheinyl transferase